MIRERNSFAFDPGHMLLPLQIGLSYIRAAVLEKTSGFEPSSDTIAPRYLELAAVQGFFPGFEPSSDTIAPRYLELASVQGFYPSLSECHWCCL